MIVPAPVQLQFQNSQPYLRHVQGAVRQTMLAYCDQEGFAFQSRPKTVESLAEKLETGRYSRWSEIDDLYACAVIIPSLVGEDAVLEFLRGAFEEERVTKRGSALKDPAVFRFECTRFVGRLRLANGGAESPDGLKRFCFEVQIRTAFEHAWLVATHGFSYKAQTVEWRRMRLAAQLKASVEQLDNLILMLEGAAGQVAENPWPDVEAKTLVLQFFKERFVRGELPSETEPKDWTRFCDNALAMLKAYGPERESPRRAVERALEIVSGDLAGRTAAEHPLSVSLWQYVFGVLARAGLLAPRGGRYRPLLTGELRALFPEVGAFSDCFDLAS